MHALRRRIARIRKLKPLQRKFIVRACLVTPWFAAALRLIGLQRLQTWNAASANRTEPQVDHDQLRYQLALAARALSALPVATSCLARALAFQWLLNRDGIHVHLRIGARVVDHRLDAHAWLEFEGQPITDRPEALRQFAVFEACTPTRDLSEA